MSINIDDLSFEEARDRMEKIIAFLEKGEMTLEEQMEAYEHGIKLTDHAESLLNSAERRAKSISSDD
jgi:exodeoxyribonuclease VII small subunit|tara:strand:+ start:118 stop:318 length:201 start_codon:yes stop_codon:yes gene_type:complete